MIQGLLVENIVTPEMHCAQDTSVTDPCVMYITIQQRRLSTVEESG